MKRNLYLFAIVALLLSSGAAFAQSGGSGGGAFSNAYLIPTVVCEAGSSSFGSTATLGCTNGTGNTPVLFADFKVSSSSNKNVLLLASLESSILTDTAVASKNGNQSSSTASGSVVVTPVVYECLGSGSSPCSTLSAAPVGAVTPNVVTFNERQQTLTANLLGLGCTANALTGVVTCTSPETIELILSTTTANGFNFVVSGLPGAGVYQVQLGVNVTTAATTNSLPAGAAATVAVGAGSLVDLDVNAETPFDSIAICSNGFPNSGGPNSCGP